MQHMIKNHISFEEVDMLRGMKGAQSLKVYIDEVGEFALNIIIESPNKKIKIQNIPERNASDGDEYPKIVIKDIMKVEPGYKLVYKGDNVKDITILRDIATWETNDRIWIVEIDIAIKIIFETEELLLLTQDSLAGFFKLFINNKMICIGELLKDYWIMKTDQVKSLIRKEINV